MYKINILFIINIIKKRVLITTKAELRNDLTIEPIGLRMNDF